MSTITPQQQTAVPAGTLNADVVHSSLGFEVQYMGISFFKGAVKDFNASVVDGRLAGIARIASLETKDENLHAHLLAPDFFDAERHPEVTFTGELVPAGSGVEVDGEITIKGVTRSAVLRGTLTGPLTDPYGNTRYGLEPARAPVIVGGAVIVAEVLNRYGLPSLAFSVRDLLDGVAKGLGVGFD